MLTKCPCCGAVFDADSYRAEKMSPVAFRILQVAPERFRRGTPLLIKDMARLTGYSQTQVHRGYRELARLGYLQTIPAKRKGNHYAGIPTIMCSQAVRQLAA